MIDVGGNDNSPYWGWCSEKGCTEAAEPLWFDGDETGDPDLLLCYRHTGVYVAALQARVRELEESIVRWGDSTGGGADAIEALYASLQAAQRGEGAA